MTLLEVRQKIFEVVSTYFQGATVIWVNQMQPQPIDPLITLNLRNVSRRSFTVDSKENFDRFFHCSAILEINLYTQGKALEEEGEEPVYENTALADIMDFCSYLESYAANDELAKNDIDIYLTETVRDLTALEQDTGFRYRAMADFVVNYTISANGMYGIMGNTVPDTSGGGTEKMASTPIETVDAVEISVEVKEGE